MSYYPLQAQPYTGTVNLTYGSSSLDQTSLDKIRAMIREEVHKALHPEEERESAIVEYSQNGKTWRGKVYLVEEDEEDE